MIDSCHFQAPMTPAVMRALRVALKANHPTIKLYGNSFYMKHPYRTEQIKVYFNLKRKRLSLEESLPKILQGHNVFGSNRLELMCLEVIKLIYAAIGVKYTPSEEGTIRKKGIRLLRLDITCSFWLVSPAMVEQLLELLYEQFRAEGKVWSAYGKVTIETVYHQQHSTRVSDKYYDKGKELIANDFQFLPNVHERDRILQIARHLLRFEVTLRGKELASRKIERFNYADYWGVDQVKAELRARIQKFKFQGELRPKLEVTELAGLGENSRAFYGLWADGANLLKYRGYRTLDRVRESLLKSHKVDIYRPPKTGCPVALRDVLDPSRAYYSSPKSLVRSGAVFSPRGPAKMTDAGY